jgi:para-aminobenzoate synthetase / 4-amino-4-deoxychorismate lyase
VRITGKQLEGIGETFLIPGDMIRKIVLRNTLSHSWLVFEGPREVLHAQSPGEVPGLLEEIQRGVDEDDLFAAGYLCYEAAPAFDAALATRPCGHLPVACFGLFAEPTELGELPISQASSPKDTDWQLTTSRPSYLERIARIKDQIELGNCYQVNYTIRQEAHDVADPWNLFLSVAVDAPYAAYIDCDDHAIVSASPELFFSLAGADLTCRPMKGTAARGKTVLDDNAAAQALHESTKNRAENIMITDMIRNDMGRIATPGTVQVASLFDIEKYASVWQMTSTVTATTDAELPEILRALFPCASVTGAPKSSSMAKIVDLEDSPREVYTGAIGYFAPSRRAQFSVAIRTAWVDKRTDVGTYGIGSGIVWDSDPDDEFEECLEKAKVLSMSVDDRDFQLLETMLWTASDGYFLITQHLDRLEDSAEYFDFSFDPTRIMQQLSDLAAQFDGPRYRIRLLLNRCGNIGLESTPEPEIEQGSPQRIRLAAEPINVDDPFLYHKTTRRHAYERARQLMPDCDDVLLWNPNGFITETTIANVIVQLDGDLFTPPVTCGLLGGTYRDWLLQNKQIKERTIHIDELRESSQITLANSVRGRYPGIFC